MHTYIIFRISTPNLCYIIIILGKFGILHWLAWPLGWKTSQNEPNNCFHRAW